jgi:hypothetical protein
MSFKHEQILMHVAAGGGAGFVWFPSAPSMSAPVSGASEKISEGSSGKMVEACPLTPALSPEGRVGEVEREA